MLSVRVTAAGAVVALRCPSSPRLPARATSTDTRRSAIASSRRAPSAEAAGRAQVGQAREDGSLAPREARAARPSARRAPRFAVQREGGMTLASSSARMTTLLPESVLARRFRGFIDPQPVAQNSFEALRKPHLVALDFDAAAIVAADGDRRARCRRRTRRCRQRRHDAEAGQDRARSRPMRACVAPNRSRSRSRRAAARGAGRRAATARTVQASLTAATAGRERRSRFSIHSLVLALCGALGAASALRFIVGA